MSDSSRAKIVMVVTCRSRLSIDEIKRRYKERMPQFRALPGLVQKYYFHDEATGEIGGVYLWDSKEALQEYAESELRKTIVSAYEVEGTPRIDVLTVMDTLR
jgi:heme-degrading monooxygenase HmoA